MDRGVRVLAPTVALASSRPALRLVWQHQPPCVATLEGHGYPGNAGEPTGLRRQELPSLLGPRASATLAPPGTGLVVLTTAAPCGTGRLMGTDPRDDHGPVHFLWTWTLAYSE